MSEIPENLVSNGSVVPIDWRRARRFVRFSALIAVLVVAFGMIFQSLLLPVGIAAFMTYLLLPLVDRLEGRGAPRLLAVTLILAAAVLVMTVAIVSIVPLIYDQARVVLRLVPVAFNTVMQVWLPSVESYISDAGWMSLEELHEMLSIGGLLSRLQAQLQAGLSGLWRTGASLAGGMVNLVLIPVVMFFLMKDYKRLATGARRFVPEDLRLPAASVVQTVSRTLRSVLKGQVTVAGILGVFYVVGLSAVGLQSAIAIGVIAGACRIIPYLDVIVGGILSAIVIVTDFQGWGHAASVALVFLIVQAVDGAFITPRVIGERVGLHPMIVIASVIAFADWFGFLGVLLAIPVVAISKALWMAAQPYYFASRAYRADDKAA